MNIQTVVYLYNGLLLDNKKECINTCNNLDESKSSKLSEETHPQKIHTAFMIQLKSTSIMIENGWMVGRVGKGAIIKNTRGMCELIELLITQTVVVANQVYNRLRFIRSIHQRKSILWYGNMLSCMFPTIYILINSWYISNVLMHWFSPWHS